MYDSIYVWIQYSIRENSSHENAQLRGNDSWDQSTSFPGRGPGFYSQNSHVPKPCQSAPPSTPRMTPHLVKCWGRCWSEYFFDLHVHMTEIFFILLVAQFKYPLPKMPSVWWIAKERVCFSLEWGWAIFIFCFVHCCSKHLPDVQSSNS